MIFDQFVATRRLVSLDAAPYFVLDYYRYLNPNIAGIWLYSCDELDHDLFIAELRSGGFDLAIGGTSAQYSTLAEAERVLYAESVETAD